MIRQGQVQVVGSSGPSLREETAQVLRQRLRAIALVISLVLGFAFVDNHFRAHGPLPAFRGGVLAGVIAIFLLLARPGSISYRRLRALELGLFGLTGLQITVMGTVLLLHYAGQADASSSNAVAAFIFVTWTLLIMAYGSFIPNTWRRAALILLPAALIPLIQVQVLCWQHQHVAAMLGANHFPFRFHAVPPFAACGSVYLAHVMNQMRREAFDARRFGQYQLHERIASGGMGEVYRAEHQLLKRPCAIKLIRPEFDQDTQALARFEREVRTTARLRHWNAVQIFDYGHTSDGKFYYVMELLEGMSVADLVRQHGPLPPERALHLLLQTCAALQEAHALGLIHRDLKPSNLFVAAQGGQHDVAKLLDFGLVKERGVQGPWEADVLDQPAKDRGQDAALTQAGKLGGSPLYMAPEQAASFTEADARSDIYALGAVAYFMLTGRPPFGGDTPQAIIRAHATVAAAAPSLLNETIPADLEQVILRCLEKKPADRYPDIRGLRAALLDCRGAHAWTEDRAARWWSERERHVPA